MKTANRAKTGIRTTGYLLAPARADPDDCIEQTGVPLVPADKPPWLKRCQMIRLVDEPAGEMQRKDGLYVSGYAGDDGSEIITQHALID